MRSIGSDHRPLRQVVTDEIRSRIVRGDLPPGERLYEDHLADQLGVSRNPVRESLQALATEGFVVLEPRRGARVASIDVTRATELFEVRAALERLVAARAAERRSRADIDDLVAIVTRGREAARRGATGELPELNTAFHDNLARIAGNLLLRETLDRLSGVIRWVYTERMSDRAEQSWVEHAELAEAIADGDASLAGSRGAAHVVAARVAFLDGARR